MAESNGQSVSITLREKETSPAAEANGLFGSSLKKFVADAVAENIEKITETAVLKALRIFENHSRVVHDGTPVSALPLPSRVANAMRRMKVNTLAELTALREQDLLLSPNMGQRSIDQLKHVLGLFGRRLAN